MIPPNDTTARRAAALELHHGGHFDAAEAAYRALLAALPDDAETWHLYGVLLGQRGAHANALAAFQRATELAPGLARNHANLGTANLALERLDAAARAFERACELAPYDAALWVDYGCALTELARYPDAVSALRKALAIDPREFTGWINLGRALQLLGRAADALQCYDTAVSLQPQSGIAHTNRGCALAALGDLARAHDAHRDAVRCEPQLIEARLNLAAALLQLDRCHEAATSYEQVLTLDPTCAAAHRGLAEASYARRDYDRATTALRRAIELQPDNAQTLCNLGHIQVELGQFEAAIVNYRRAIAIEPTLGRAWLGLAEVRRFEAGDPDLTRLRALWQRTDLDAVTRATIGFAYAKACEDAQEFSAAGNAFIEANALIRPSFDYEVATDERLMQEIEAVVTAPLLRQWGAAANPSTRPIFIVGLPRSGTTLLEQMLASHPHVHGAGEVPDFRRLVLELTAGDHPAALAQVGTDRLARLAQAYLDALMQFDSTAAHVTDKLPANFLHAGLIATIFPRASILHCERDPLETCWSCFRKQFARAQPWSYDLDEIARYYRAYRQLMRHWDRVLPGRVHRVRYEHLVTEPETELRAALEYCGLSWNPACLEFHRHARPVRTASAAQVRRPLYSDSIGHTRHYGAILAPLRIALGDTAAGSQR